jgi:hypothetical protein
MFRVEFATDCQGHWVRLCFCPTNLGLVYKILALRSNIYRIGIWPSSESRLYWIVVTNRAVTKLRFCLQRDKKYPRQVRLKITACCAPAPHKDLSNFTLPYALTKYVSSAGRSLNSAYLRCGGQDSSYLRLLFITPFSTATLSGNYMKV